MAIDTERLEELNQELESSLTDTIHVLQGILNEVKAGSYTPEQAGMDHENLMFSEGIDFMSIIGEIASIG